MFQNARLSEYGRFFGVESSCKAVDQYILHVLFHHGCVRILRCQGVPVSDKIIAFIFVLELDPVLKCPDEVPNMQTAAWLYSAKDSFFRQ